MFLSDFFVPTLNGVTCSRGGSLMEWQLFAVQRCTNILFRLYPNLVLMGMGETIAQPGTFLLWCLGCSVEIFPAGSLQEVYEVGKREASLCLESVCH